MKKNIALSNITHGKFDLDLNCSSLCLTDLEVPCNDVIRAREDILLVIELYNMTCNSLQALIQNRIRMPKTILGNIRSFFRPLEYCSISENQANALLQLNPLNGKYLLFSEQIVNDLVEYSNYNSHSLCWVDYLGNRRLTLREHAIHLRDEFYKRKYYEEHILIASKIGAGSFLLLAITSSFFTALNSAKEFEKIPINPDKPNETYSNSYGNLAVFTELLLNNYLIMSGLLLIYFNYFKQSSASSFTLTSGRVLTPESNLTKTSIVPLSMFTPYKGVIHKTACDKLEAWYDSFGKNVAGEFMPFVLSPTNILFTPQSSIHRFSKLTSRLLNQKYQDFEAHNILHTKTIDYTGYVNEDFLHEVNKFKLTLLETSKMIGMDDQIERLAYFATYLYQNTLDFFIVF